MADYKRMVSYMYQYENGVKKKNVGFARIEIRSGQIKLTLHMQLLGQLDSIFPTYLIQRDKDGMELIYLGDSVLKSQVMDSKLNASENNTMDSGYDFSAFSGILLFFSEDIFYATQWDDKSIVVSEVMEALKPSKKKSIDKKASSDIKEDGQETTEADIEVVSRDTTQVDIKEDGQEATEVEKKENFLNQILFQKDQEEEVFISDENMIPKYKLPGGYKFIEAFQNRQMGSTKHSSATKVEENALMETEIESVVDETAVSQNISADFEMRDNIDYEADVQEKILKDAARQQEILQEKFQNEKMFQEELIHNTERNEEEGRKVREAQAENREEDEGQEHSGAARIFNHYPRIYPFEDNEITMCVKIEPKDIGYLPMGAWGLSNNSFLLHGFYCYHHLIFAKMVDHYGSRYIIGVPGIYHSREQFMARMFGFENFKSIRKRELKQGDFGYWYLVISM